MKRLIIVLVVLILLSSVKFALADKEEVLILEGTATEVGSMWGEINRDSILKKYNLFFAGADEFFSPESLVGKEDQLRVFAQLSKDISKAIGCSYWIEELNAIADVIGVDRDLFIAYAFGRYRNLALLYTTEVKEGCTSLTITPPATKDGQIIFHKTRDTGLDLQAAYLKRITDVPPGDKEPYKFFGEMGTSDTGISFFVNEMGLAGSADVPADKAPTMPYDPGEPRVREVAPPKYDGFMNHYTLRYFAEQCKDVDEVSEALHYLVDNGYVASGKWGTNYLFVDARGKALHILDVCHEIVEEETDLSLKYLDKTCEGIYSTVHYRTHPYLGDPFKALVSNYGNITVELVNSPQVVKHPGMWAFRSSQSAATILIDPDYPETLTTIFVTLPGYGYSIPFLMGANATPVALMDGTVFETQRESYRYSEYYETILTDEWRRFISGIRGKVEAGEDVTEELNDNFLYMVNKVLSMNK